MQIGVKSFFLKLYPDHISYMKNNLFTPLVILLVSVVLSTCTKHHAYLQTDISANYIIIQPGGSFNPATLRMTGGTSVTFVNNDARPHKIVSINHRILTNVIMPGLSSLCKNDNAIGTLHYQCSLDINNRGTIIVTPL